MISEKLQKIVFACRLFWLLHSKTQQMESVTLRASTLCYPILVPQMSVRQQVQKETVH